MKTINVVFDDNEHDELLRLKDSLSWHDFILREARRK